MADLSDYIHVVKPSFLTKGDKSSTREHYDKEGRNEKMAREKEDFLQLPDWNRNIAFQVSAHDVARLTHVARHNNGTHPT